MRRVAGIDVGGTFTDLLLYERAPTAAAVRFAKVPTTAAEPGGRRAGGDRRRRRRARPTSTSSSTAPPPPPTPCSSARSPRSGSSPRAAFATRWSSAAARGPKPYGMFGTFEPLIPRELRLEVDERMNAAGEVVIAARRGGSARRRSQALLAAGCESLVIHFLHAYANPAHELRAGEIVASALAERLRHARPRAAVGVPRIRARHDRVGERRRAADPRPLRQPPAGRAGGAGLRARPAGHERQRRHGLGAPGGARGGQDRHVGPGLRRDGGGGDAGAVGRRQRHHLRHGRHLDRRGADPRRRAARCPPSSPSTTACRSTCRWWTCAASAPAAARSPAINAAGMLQVGPESAGSEPGPDLLRPRRHAPDHHRRQPAARPARSRRAAGGRRGR